MREILKKFSGMITDIFRTRKGVFLALVSLYLFGVGFTIIFLSPLAYGPVHHGDETEYWQMAYAFYNGTFSFSKFPYPPFFYPLSLFPAFALFYPDHTYVAAKVLNALYITSVIFPCYFILRKFAERGLSFAATIVILISPIHLVISRLLLSENVFYPLFMWAIFFSFSGFITPNNRLRYIENAAFGLVLGLLIITRNIAIALVPVFFFIWWIKPDSEEKMPLLFSKSKAIRSFLILFVLFTVLGIWLFSGFREGLSVSQLLGMDLRAASSDPAIMTKTNLFRWAVFYSSHVIISAGPLLGILVISIFRANWKAWQEDAARWFIATGLMTVSLIAICTKHSWEVDPDFEQLMGRYLLYLGSLFIITAIAAVKKIHLPDLHSSDWGYWTISIFTISLFYLAYSIQYQGLFFLDRPLETSGSSPYGYFIRNWGRLYVPVCIFLILLINWFLGRKKTTLLKILIIFLSLFSLIGNYLVFQNMLLPQQINTIQANYLIKALKLGQDGQLVPLSEEISISAEPGKTGITMATKLLRVFLFYGYRNVTILEDERLSGEPEAYQLIRAGEYEYRVDGVNREDFAACDCLKYEFLDKFYIVTWDKLK